MYMYLISGCEFTACFMIAVLIHVFVLHLEIVCRYRNYDCTVVMIFSDTYFSVNKQWEGDDFSHISSGGKHFISEIPQPGYASHVE